MAGKKRTPDVPEWFRPEAYFEAATLDLGDWLLNLTVRRWLHDKPDAAIEDALRTHGPLLRRGDARQMVALGWQGYLGDAVEIVIENAQDFAALLTKPDLPSDVIEALRTGRVRDGIKPLRVAELYRFERMLPDDLRAYAAGWRPGAYLAPCDPQAFDDSLDDAFGAGRQHVSRFVRVDLSLPADVLHADLQSYLRREKARLAAMGGPQPYRDAARLKSRQSPAQLAHTLANIGLLPFLDLDRWQRAERRELSFAAVCEMAGVIAERRKRLRSYARRALRQMELHAWFARLDRSLEVKPRRRKPVATRGA